MACSRQRQRLYFHLSSQGINSLSLHYLHYMPPYHRYYWKAVILQAVRGAQPALGSHYISQYHKRADMLDPLWHLLHYEFSNIAEGSNNNIDVFWTSDLKTSNSIKALTGNALNIAEPECEISHHLTWASMLLYQSTESISAACCRNCLPALLTTSCCRVRGIRVLWPGRAHHLQLPRG